MELQALIHYLREKKVEAMSKGYFLHGIMERNGIVVIDFKKKVFHWAQADGDGESIDETQDNLSLLGWKEDQSDNDCARRWWNDFITVDSDGNPIDEETFSPPPPTEEEIDKLKAIVKGL